MRKKSYIVGISGGSASGKTKLIQHLKAIFSQEQATFIAMDNYYYDRSEQKRDHLGRINFDHPQAVNLDLLHEHLLQLLRGNSVQIRQYNYNNPALPSPMVTYSPAPLLILEGIFIFFKPEIAQLIDLKVFIDAEEPVRLVRRIKRDTQERGYPLEEVMEQYISQVRPMYRKFIEPHKDECDIIIPNNIAMDKGIDVLVKYLYYQLNAIYSQTVEILNKTNEV